MKRMQRERVLIYLLMAAACGLALQPASAQQPYRILDRWTLPDPGGWDYLNVDSTAHRLYVTRGDHVDIIDTTTGKLAGAISGLGRTHGVAFDTTGKLGYITDSGTNSVIVFDRATLAKVTSIAVGTGPDSIVFEPATQTIWAFNGHSQDATVIDAATQKVVATIALPGRPEFAAVDGTGMVYDNIEDKSEIVRLDAHSKTLTATWPLTG